MKWSLYEGGIREPFLVRWPGRVPAGQVNRSTVLHALDLFPSLCRIAGVELPKDVPFDGEDLSGAVLGQEVSRRRPVFWEYGRNARFLYPQAMGDRSPRVAVRAGHWRLLLNADGSACELYDLAADPAEAVNRAEREPEVVQGMSRAALEWRPSLIVPAPGAAAARP